MVEEENEETKDNAYLAEKTIKMQA